ncbi:MAG: tRNA pseudouridine(55) synthase TruB [Alphaproteobacteria bacterium]|nr:tRNA pseudouridine(55) synthase TruB [Alphaproteobacteria bacterium]MCL2890185.1 tRNA pseudouridine(55) synthase TruB [Alphaproteobacteria bacterium]
MKSGWIILDKPSGMSSRAAGGRVARMLGIKKFGHLGTLDPMASGVLPIAFGEATKMIPYIEQDWKRIHIDEFGRRMGEKEYAFEVQWGFETDTLDITGTVIKTEDNKTLPEHDEIYHACNNFIGEIMQIPPAYSAIHVDGRRAYELARKGQKIDIPARKITIYDLDITGWNDTGHDMFLVNCGTGTYVRSLARDIGAVLGRLNTVTMIRRTRTHFFEIKDAVSLDFLENLYNNAPDSVAEHLHPVDFGLDDILVSELNEMCAKLFVNGGVIITKDDSIGLRRVYHNGQFIGIGMNDSYTLVPKRVVNNN